MTLRSRLVLSLVIIAAVLTVPLFVARSALIRLHGQVRSLREGEFQASLMLGRLRDAMGDVRAREVALGVVRSDTVHVQLEQALSTAEALADSLDRHELDGAAQRIHRDLQQVRAAAEDEFRAMRTGQSAVADTISQQRVAPALHDADVALSPAELVLRTRTRQRVLDAESALGDAERISLAALAAALVLAAGIAWWLTRSISEPVTKLEQGMRAVADGDLGHPLHLRSDRHDEFGRLALSFQEMTQQLAELDKLKAEFASIASHELKTPINVILGYLQLMQEGVYGPLTEKQVQVTQTLEAQGRTLARLAIQLLDVNRFEAGGGRIEPRPVNLYAMLDELERSFHVLAVQRGIDFRVVRQPGLPDEVQWDPERINEVTGNLLSNAFKFTPAGGRVELDAAPADGNAVRLAVSDTGAGIPAEQLPHVFEKFYQANNQASASAKGTGLGLAIAKAIVEAHQGEIRCDSIEGEGTTFTLLLPVEATNRRRALNMTGKHAFQRGTRQIDVLDTMGLISSSFGQWQGVRGGQWVEFADGPGFRYLRLEFSRDVLIGCNAVGLTEHSAVLRSLITHHVRLGEWKDRLLRDPTLIQQAYAACVEQHYMGQASAFHVPGGVPSGEVRHAV